MQGVCDAAALNDHARFIVGYQPGSSAQNTFAGTVGIRAGHLRRPANDRSHAARQRELSLKFLPIADMPTPWSRARYSPPGWLMYMTRYAGRKGWIVLQIRHRLITLEYAGDGYRVSLIRPEGGRHQAIRSSGHRDVSSARARATQWSLENANSAIREFGTIAMGKAQGQGTVCKHSRWVS